MAFDKDAKKPEKALPPNDPAVIAEKRTEQDRANAAAKLAEKQRVEAELAKQADAYHAAQKAEEEKRAAAERKRLAEEQKKLAAKPLTEQEQAQLEELERQAQSGKYPGDLSMRRLAELRQRSKL